MALPALRFAPYADSAAVPNVVVDGSPSAGTTLTISHWPGLPMPPGCEADTSAQMAFRYLDRGADLHGDAQVVTNNHFDQDGLAGVYALTRPDDALRRRSLLEGLATAGDFAVAPSREAARLSMAVAALGDPAVTPLGDLPDDYDDRCALLYPAALELLPRWLDDVDACRALWAAEDAELDAATAAIASGAVTIAEDPAADLAVVTLSGAGRTGGHRFVGRAFDGGIHPMALHAATERTTILTLDPDAGRHHLTCRYEGWVQYQSRPIPRRVDLQPLADHLSELEDGARWVSTPPSDLTPELYPAADGPGSSLDPRTVVAAVTQHLITAPPAWNPYPAAREGG